ncbi:MAG: two-component sensor histidine kinase [Prevotellaceae bacterium]|jgi:two-component system OmpR family sensor kinase/two-component system phosphate regulon sensor histidine kinase PhoR|nr:two-component sensor histidine kinase [Prevotellaceae bacterium]
MDTASTLNDKTRFLTYSRKLFLSVLSLFLLFAGSLLLYQYHREKEHKIELLNVQLQDCNEELYMLLKHTPDSLPIRVLDQYPREHFITDLRITVINRNGDVLYDTNKPSHWSNHLNRPEVEQAILHRNGYDVRRTSETTGLTYFYSATCYDNLIIRSALPYNINLVQHLAADQHYLWFTLTVSLLLIGVFYQYTSRLGTAVARLREFAMHADRDESVETSPHLFPDNELGAISQHIVRIYLRLRETKEALYIEREKLIMHLQSSHEGLGVFTREKKEILVNNLFTRYANLISDTNLSATEDIFAVKEFEEITDFINHSLSEGRKRIDINKDGRSFVAECIVFQDMSFEITINDVTQEEEQNRLKRQLTQNIAHELKTPVSSIQGYLETLVNNDRISDKQRRSFMERCYAQSNRLSRLLRDISVLTRMDEAANMIDMEPLDLSVLITSMLNEVSRELEEKQIQVVNNLRPTMMLQGNYSLLYSVFRNLTDNTITYAGTHIRITIRCFREDEHFYYISFADNGVGVPPEHLNRLFERFYRVDKGRSRKLGGTGLGLAIVKNAVIIHGGTISAKNTPGGGLEFVFTLAKHAAASDTKPYDLKNKK